jgi:hypothetical protein
MGWSEALTMELALAAAAAAICLASAFLARSIAEPKGYGGLGFFCLGLVAGFFAPIIAACLPDLGARERRDRDFLASLFRPKEEPTAAAAPKSLRNCPSCKGLVMAYWPRCQHCGAELG